MPAARPVSLSGRRAPMMPGGRRAAAKAGGITSERLSYGKPERQAGELTVPQTGTPMIAAGCSAGILLHREEPFLMQTHFVVSNYRKRATEIETRIQNAGYTWNL